MQAIDNLLRNINWNQIDYLVIDTPPGTGDTQLSLIQNVPISGVVLVTLPQQLSIKIVHKSIAMFKMLKVRHCYGIFFSKYHIKNFVQFVLGTNNWNCVKYGSF